MAPWALGASQKYRPSRSWYFRLKPVGHDLGLWYTWAPRRNAANAAGLVRRQSLVPLASNHTNPSSP